MTIRNTLCIGKHYTWLLCVHLIMCLCLQLIPVVLKMLKSSIVFAAAVVVVLAHHEPVSFNFILLFIIISILYNVG